MCKSKIVAKSDNGIKILTNPQDGVANNGLDNADGNLICKTQDIISVPSLYDQYTIEGLLGTGTFGQVFKCFKSSSKSRVAVKIVKNKPAYYNQGLLEMKIIKLLNNNFDPKDEKHLVRLLESFEHKGHICLSFELLSISLLDLLTQNQFRGLSINAVQTYFKQVCNSIYSKFNLSIRKIM